jgi:nitrate/nitrite-specific signal transduction histidine kinase
MQAKQKHDSLVINLAGRQRMLSQKMTKEILLFSEGHLSSEKVINTINVFHATLNSLNHGGKAPLDLAQTQFVELPRPSSKMVVDQLQKVESTWGKYRENASEILAEKNQLPLEQIKEINVPLLQEMNNAVFLMDQEATKKVQTVRNLLIAGCVVLVALFLFTIRIILRDRQAD